MRLTNGLLKLIIPTFSLGTLLMTMSRADEIRNGEPRIILLLLMMALGKAAVVLGILLWDEEDRKPAMRIVLGGLAFLALSFVLWNVPGHYHVTLLAGN